MLPTRRERKLAERGTSRRAWPLMLLLLGLGALLATVYAGTRATMAKLATARPVGSAGTPAEDIKQRSLDLADVLHLMPGTARSRGENAAPDVPTATRTEAPSVMRVEAGRLVLDFGAVSAGSDLTIPDVLRITNEWHQPAMVELAPSEDGTSFMGGATIAGAPARVLGAGETVQVDVRLRVDAGLAPGEHRGALVVQALGGFAHASLPARVRVLPPAAAAAADR